MPTPPTSNEKDPGVRLLAWLAMSGVFWLAAFAAATVILARDPGAAVRAGGVAIALIGILPWIWTVSRAIAAQEEFTRRIHLIALSWAFAATGLFVVMGDLLIRAHFIDYLPLLHVLMFMVIAWWLSIVVTSRYFR